MIDTGSLVKAWRIRRGLSQTQLAERAGTGQAAISRIESSRDLPTLALLNRIASALDCDLKIDFTSSYSAARRGRRSEGG
ncbi:helix-turn-helix transcriptional regulator [Streptomyces sp. NPDC005301]|uniref:helix-turn-helix domain-containing protein n=1 Tax=Streptomyces sp. NPDC005301 TaxID=3156874 RepID=UPI0033BD3F22